MPRVVIKEALLVAHKGLAEVSVGNTEACVLRLVVPKQMLATFQPLERNPSLAVSEKYWVFPSLYPAMQAVRKMWRHMRTRCTDVFFAIPIVGTTTHTKHIRL